MDRALLHLPLHHGRLYRGINVRFSEKEYSSGQTVCWPAFSSASSERSVAEEFVKGDEGTLFFVQSAGARAISRFSKYPDEAEVLFRPNTTFEISQAVYGSSAIGQFYACIDNIAMTEQTHVACVKQAPEQVCAWAPRRPSLSVHVPWFGGEWCQQGKSVWGGARGKEGVGKCLRAGWCGELREGGGGCFSCVPLPSLAQAPPCLSTGTWSDRDFDRIF